MKNYLKTLFLVIVISLPFTHVNAQYYQIANQLMNMVSPALSNSVGYKGFVDVSYVAGLGDRKVDFAGVSTSQGFNYRSWFYMGAGIGLDVAMSHTNQNFGMERYGGYWDHKYKTTGIMVPVFTDFRFNFGNSGSTSFFIDARIGASFLMGNDYLAVADGFITNRQYFYLKPSVGVRIPVNKTAKQAVNIGVTYQLLTSNYWYNSPSPYNSTLSSLGAMISFDW